MLAGLTGLKHRGAISIVYYITAHTLETALALATGVSLSADADDNSLQLLRVDNSNDGKRSEWCEFLRAGDQVRSLGASRVGASR